MPKEIIVWNVRSAKTDTIETEQRRQTPEEREEDSGQSSINPKKKR